MEISCSKTYYLPSVGLKCGSEKKKKKKKTIEMSQTTVGYVLNTQCIFKLRFEKFFRFFFTVHLVAIVTSVKV